MARQKTYISSQWQKLTNFNKIFIIPAINRSSRLEVLCKKGVLRNFTKFTRKHLYQSLFFNRLWHRCFPVNFTKFLRTLFLTEHLRWLLLYYHCYCQHLNIFNTNTQCCLSCRFFELIYYIVFLISICWTIWFLECTILDLIDDLRLLMILKKSFL